MKLPTVRGANLLRQTLEFPAAFTGDLNLVFVAFKQWQQREVDSWVPQAEKLRQSMPRLQYYEFPTIQSMNFLARTFINEGMRAGIPDPATRARTVTLYLNKSKFQRALDIPDERHIQVFLFDGDGHVLWRSRGPFTQAKGESLETAVFQYQPV